MKIALVVPGRFVAVELANALLHRGHDVQVFMSYPRQRAVRAGAPADRVTSFAAGAPAAAGRLRRHIWLGRPGRWWLPAFGSWAARRIARERWDAAICWSGAAEETLASGAARGTPVLLGRFSAHIAVQAEILAAESARVGARLEQPSPWIVAREEREYELADTVIVPSSFARDTFLQRGFPEHRLRLWPLAADVARFDCPVEDAAARRSRILAGGPLQVLYVGALCYRKGLFDLARLVSDGSDLPWRLQLVGGVAKEARDLVRRLDANSRVAVAGHRPEAELPGWYRSADLFVFPTVEDGYPVVLAQAQACGLPILTTTNCSGPDLVEEGHTGWVVPIRRPDRLGEVLAWADVHRPELAAIADRAAEVATAVRTWNQAAAELEALVG